MIATRTRGRVVDKIKWFVLLPVLLPGILLANDKNNDKALLDVLKQPFEAPALRLRNMENRFVDLPGFKGRVVLLNFWASWCPPCRVEMGSLERFNLAMSDKGVTVLAVNIGEDVDTVRNFLEIIQPRPTFPIVFDQDSHTTETWRIKGMPTTYVIDPAGMVRYRATGKREFDHPDLIEQVMKLREMN